MPLSADVSGNPKGGAVSIRDLRRSFGAVKALDGVSLKIGAGRLRQRYPLNLFAMQLEKGSFGDSMQHAISTA